MRWPDIVTVRIYKRNLLTTDLVCMELVMATGQRFELHEEMPGWDAFVADLPDRLPGCSTEEDWLPHVAVPAFATNQVTIFTRQPRGRR